MPKPRARRDAVVILTPLEDATVHRDRCFAGLAPLTRPRRLSLGFRESDRTDDAGGAVAAPLADLRSRDRRARLWRRDLGVPIPPRCDRWAPACRIPRRALLARGRTHLLFRALGDEEWALWLDVGVSASGNRRPFVRDPNPWTRQTVGELETEGLGIMARDMGYQRRGRPNLEIIPASE